MTPQQFETFLTSLGLMTRRGYRVNTVDAIYNAIWENDLDEEVPFVVVNRSSENGDSYSSESRKMVIQFGRQFFQKTGYYDSWESEDSWDGALVEVIPQEIVTISYKEKN